VAEKGKDHKVNASSQSIAKFLGVPKYRYGKTEEKDEVGLTNGLAWTEFGGELLQTEVVVLPGRGKLLITGKLGEVMQESAHAALSYVRSIAENLGLPREFYRKLDLHVHVPEGAIPKDGPSAGITIGTSIVSALLRLPVKREVAMTGEITLRGRVLPIGGLKEKIIAAHRHQIKTVVIPRDNEKDIKEIPARILKAVELIPVDHMNEVLKLALVVDDPESLFKPAPLPLAPEAAFVPEGETPAEIQAH
jgi:ATP-dependent Lon protease